jgi:hypothetical protein
LLLKLKRGLLLKLKRGLLLKLKRGLLLKLKTTTCRMNYFHVNNSRYNVRAGGCGGGGSRQGGIGKRCAQRREFIFAKELRRNGVLNMEAFVGMYSRL